ncbi:hypothetical protein Pam5_50 [Pseudanabaena phage Pam5]|nr:hypothetical protein Pam5_50 [Pseudanabaena phage Pam5]
MTGQSETKHSIAGRTILEWAQLARRDDCFERMVPSDLRQLVGLVSDLIDAASMQMAAHDALEGRVGYAKWQAMEDAAIKALAAALRKASPTP